MRAGGNEAPPDFDLTVSHTHTHRARMLSLGKHLPRMICGARERAGGARRHRRWGVNVGDLPRSASSITIFQRPAVLGSVHPSSSFSSPLHVFAHSPLSVKSTVWLCLRQQPDGFKLLAWAFSGWWTGGRPDGYEEYIYFLRPGEKTWEDVSSASLFSNVIGFVAVGNWPKPFEHGSERQILTLEWDWEVIYIYIYVYIDYICIYIYVYIYILYYICFYIYILYVYIYIL